METSTIIALSGQAITVIAVLLTRSDKAEQRVNNSLGEIKTLIQTIFSDLKGKVDIPACDKLHQRIDRDINNIAVIAGSAKNG